MHWCVKRVCETSTTFHVASLWPSSTKSGFFFFFPFSFHFPKRGEWGGLSFFAGKSHLVHVSLVFGAAGPGEPTGSELCRGPGGGHEFHSLGCVGELGSVLGAIPSIPGWNSRGAVAVQ